MLAIITSVKGGIVVVMFVCMSDRPSDYLKVIYHPLYGMNNYVLIWGDWLS